MTRSSDFLAILATPAWQHVIVALLHSLWQAVLVALALRFVLALLPAGRTGARYGAAIAALGLIVLGVLVTYSVVGGPREQAAAAAAPMRGADETPASQRTTRVAARTPAADTARAATNGRDGSLRSESRILGALAAPYWVPLCAAAWLLGVGTTLLRAAWLVTGARRLARGGRVTDERVLQVVARLRAVMGVRRTIAIIDAGSIGPAVLGVVRPALLLPAALMADLPLDALEGMVAHELAHIRRHDYLMNLVQMFVEAALFFNPAVWWVSRQIRREREACCDAEAVRVTGQPITYAAALADWASRTRAFAPDRGAEGAVAPPPRAAAAALYFAGEGGAGERSGALDRVKRLLVADYRPELRVSAGTLVGWLCVSLVALAALWRGTEAGVALAAQLLSPAERVEQLSKERDELRPIEANEDEDRPSATISGTLKTAGGEPLPKRLQGDLLSRKENSSYSESVSMTAPEFKLKARPGSNWIMVFAKDYAPAVVGPMQIVAGQSVEDVEIVLERGFSAELKVVDPAGKPVPAASASAMLSETGISVGAFLTWRAVEQGKIVIEHINLRPYDFTIRAPGYQPKRLTNVRLQPNETLTVEMDRADLTAGIVVTPDGTPIAGAEIRAVIAVNGPDSGGDSEGGPPRATSGEDGMFSLDSLSDNATYVMLVDTPHNGRRVFQPIKAGDRDLRWEVGPDLVVSGRIVGDMSKLKRVKGRLYVNCHQPVELHLPGTNHSDFIYQRVNVEIEGEEGKFRLHNLLPGEATLGVGERSVKVEIVDPQTEVKIDLDEPPPPAPATRHVTLRFIGPDAGAYPEGTVSVWTRATDVEGSGGEQILSIKSGVVEFEAPVPGTISYSLKNIVGYWCQGGASMLEAGDEPFELQVQVLPAGAVRGKVLNVDGSPAAASARVGTQNTIHPSPTQWISFSSDNLSVDSHGEFFLSPLPFGTDYVVRASRGFENAVSEPVPVDAEHVAPSVTLRFTRAAAAGGRVIGADGMPAARVPVGLEFRGKSSTSYSPPQTTDREGRFRFEGLSKDVGEYWAVVEPDRRPAKTQARLNIGGPDIEIHLDSAGL